MIELLDTPSKFERLAKERIKEAVVSLIEKKKLVVRDGKKVMKKVTTDQQKKKSNNKQFGSPAKKTARLNLKTK